MIVDLCTWDGETIGPAEIPPHRAFPLFLHLPALNGSQRFFHWVGPYVGEDSDRYKEVYPVTAELVPQEGK